MCADDTEIKITSDDQVELIETSRAELLNIEEWIRINQFSLNHTNIEYMRSSS